MRKSRKTKEKKFSTDDPESILSALENRMIPETSRTTVILTYLSIGFLIFLVIFGLAGGMKLLKENVFFVNHH